MFGEFLDEVFGGFFGLNLFGDLCDNLGGF
jgi:hypothetical protein